MLSFTEAVAEEVRGTGVRVMAAHPGATATGFFDRTTASMNPRFTDDPADVAVMGFRDVSDRDPAAAPGR
ncbi:hypothetical protein [Streptomyces sp. NA03103]|uniref:hypothetical protein n=1 Tax=Streptomyces sp. NA03103 TaxID=2742134 RepID=UPI0020CAFD19|nr:hypothetical protein [Streptomyces sp. NA03103]